MATLSGVTLSGGITLTPPPPPPPPPATGSAVFDGSAIYRISANSAFVIGTNDFTAESWVKTGGGGSAIMSLGNAGDSPQMDILGSVGTGGLYIVWTTVNVGPFATPFQTSQGSFPANTWNHVAVVRNSGITTVYINGVAKVSAADTTNYTSNWFAGGWDGHFGYLLNGSLSETRLVNGTAVYTSNFTPAPVLTTVSNTAVLMNYATSATLLDDSSPNQFVATNIYIDPVTWSSNIPT